MNPITFTLKTMCWKGTRLEDITVLYESNIINVLKNYPDNHVWYGYTKSAWLDAFKMKNKWLESIKKDNLISKIQIEKIKKHKRTVTIKAVDKLCSQLEIALSNNSIS